MTNSQEKRQSTVTNPEITQMLDLSNENFKAFIIAILHEVKIKELEINGKTEVFSRETKTIKKEQNRNLGIKTHNIKNKKSLWKSSIAECRRQRKESGNVMTEQQKRSSLKYRQKKVGKKISRDSENYGKIPRGNHVTGRRERVWSRKNI